MNDFSNYLVVAINAAISTGEILKKGFLFKDFSIEKKDAGIHNLVTTYDYLAEKNIIDIILKAYPFHSIISEEKGLLDNQDKDFLWIVDPLDGTVNFAHQIPLFCVSIALQVQKKVVLGVVYNPICNELFVAQKGKGAFLNGTQIKVSNVKKIKGGFFSTGFPYDMNKKNDFINDFIKVAKLGLSIRKYGTAVLSLAYVAMGRIDLFFESSLKIWDCASGMLLVNEAQGQVTDWQGKDFRLQENNKLIASNKFLHNQFLNLLT